MRDASPTVPKDYDTATQGLYRHSNAFFPDFPGLAKKTKFQGFPGLKNPFFQDFPGHVPFTKMCCMRSKSAYTKSDISVSAL